MSVESLIAATEASAAPVTTTEEPKVASPTTETPAEGTQQPVEGQQATPETPVPAEPTTEVEETEPDLDATPENDDLSQYKELYKDKPDLRDRLYREKAWRELGTFSDVREIVQRIPTVEDAETLASQADNLTKLGETFRNDTQAFVESLEDLDKPAFLELVNRVNSDEFLQAAAPQVLRERVEETSNRVIQATWEWAQQHGTDEEKAAIQIFARLRGFRQPAPQTAPPVNSELEKLRREKAEREQNDTKARFQEFYSQTDTAIAETSLSEIQSSIKKVMPNVNEEQLKTLTARAWNNVIKTVNEQPQTKAQINRYLQDAQKGRDGLEQHKAMVNFVTGRNAKQIPVAVKEAVNWLTKQIISTNSNQITTRKAIADKTKDVGTGVQGTTSAAALAPEKADKKTFNSVMDRLNKQVADLRSGATR